MGRVRCVVVRRSHGRFSLPETTSAGGMFLPVWFGVQNSLSALSDSVGSTYLSHGSEHFIATPFRRTPIVVVLLNTSYADGTVATTAAAQESASGHVDLTSI